MIGEIIRASTSWEGYIAAGLMCLLIAYAFKARAFPSGATRQPWNRWVFVIVSVALVGLGVVLLLIGVDGWIA